MRFVREFVRGPLVIEPSHEPRHGRSEEEAEKRIHVEIRYHARGLDGLARRLTDRTAHVRAQTQFLPDRAPPAASAC